MPFGALFFCLSLTPSLLPRDWLFQGLIGGINAAIGYGIGVVDRKGAPSASCYATAPGGHRRRRVLYWMKVGSRRCRTGGLCADADTGGGLAAPGVGADGHGGARARWATCARW